MIKAEAGNNYFFCVNFNYFLFSSYWKAFCDDVFLINFWAKFIIFGGHLFNFSKFFEISKALHFLLEILGEKAAKTYFEKSLLKNQNIAWFRHFLKYLLGYVKGIHLNGVLLAIFEYFRVIEWFDFTGFQNL